MICTLLTDLGTKDAAAAATRALLQKHVRGLQVVDLSHLVSRHNWREAAYILSGAYAAFPPGTVHVIPVGALAGKPCPSMILASHNGHYFIAPDNGLLPATWKREDISAYIVQQYGHAPLFHEWMSDAASVCRQLAENAPLDFPSCTPVAHPDAYSPQAGPVGIACKPLYRDRYQNLVLNIREEEFLHAVGNRTFTIRTFRGVAISEVSSHYSDVAAGAPLCRFNSRGYLEIAVNHGSALHLFGIDPDDSTALSYHTIRIALR